MPDAFMCTWKKDNDKLENPQRKSLYQINIQKHFCARYISNKIMMAGGNSFCLSYNLQNPFHAFHPVLLNSYMPQCSLQKSPILPGPDPQLHSGRFEHLKTQTLLLCKSLGKNQKNVQKVGVLFLLTDNRRFLQVNLSYFCWSNTADLLCKASSLSCSLPPAHVFSVHHFGLLPAHIVYCLQMTDHPHWHFLSLVEVRFRKTKLTDLVP